MTKEKPAKTFDRIPSVHWTRIMESMAGPTSETDGFVLFGMLHTLASQVIQSQQRSSEKAKAFLQELGGCKPLFHRALRKIIGLRTLQMTPENMGIALEDLAALLFFVPTFLSCLVAPPSEHETDVLVRLAHHMLNEFRPTVVALMGFNEEIAEERYDVLVFLTSDARWTMLKDESTEQRWRRFEILHLSDMNLRNVAADAKKDQKEVRQDVKKDLKKQLETMHGKDEMCANCYVLEKDAPDAKLFRCGWCRQVNYCSPECQKTHWKKAHKKQCAGKKKS
jgi:hypothetical protein